VYIHWRQVVDWFVQILAAMHYLHDTHKILHRDLKAQNIFLVPQKASAVRRWDGDGLAGGPAQAVSPKP